MLLIIEAKNGLMEVDDFFQLNIRKMIAKTIVFFDQVQYQKVKKILLNITHPYEIWKYEENDRNGLFSSVKSYIFDSI